MILKNHFFGYSIMLSMLVLGSAVQVTANQPPVAVAQPNNQTIYSGMKRPMKHGKMIIRYNGLLPVVGDIPEKEIVWDRLMCFMDQIRRMGVKPSIKVKGIRTLKVK
jgi:hypothetical protein